MTPRDLHVGGKNRFGTVLNLIIYQVSILIENVVIFNSIIGLEWIPSCFHVITSINSSIVPTPPGIATSTSESLNIFSFLLFHLLDFDLIQKMS